MSVGLKVKVEADYSRLEKFTEKIRQTVETSLKEMAAFIGQAMRGEVRVRSGRMRDSIASFILGDRVLVGPTIHYAVFVERRFGLFRTGERVSDWLGRRRGEFEKHFINLITEKLRS